MFNELSDLREPLLAARLLREEILGQALLPSSSVRLAAEFVKENGRAASGDALTVALVRGRSAATPILDRSVLVEIADAAGGGDLRKHPGSSFQGKPAPAPSKVEDLLAELLETLNSPVAAEFWPPPVRAFGAHFLLRLVQPFDGPPAAIGHAVEAMLLAADGFPADRMLLPEPDVGVGRAGARPDPDAFARARTHRLVERLGETRERVHAAAARSVAATWAERRDARLNPRQARLVRWLAEREGAGTVSFVDYVALHAGRKAPSVRSLQRDFQGLRERGLLRAVGDEFELETSSFTFGHTTRNSGPRGGSGGAGPRSTAPVHAPNPPHRTPTSG